MKKLWLAASVPVAILLACVSAGTTETQIGPNLWEIRAWDGNQCDKHTSDAKCKKVLMPQVNSQASIVCGSRNYELKACRRKPGVSGDRYYCSVVCGGGGDKK